MATFLQDTFTGSGSIDGHTPDTTFGTQTWQIVAAPPGLYQAQELVLSGGYATCQAGDISCGVLNGPNTDYGVEPETDVAFVFTTGPNIYANTLFFTVSSGGRQFQVRIFVSGSDLYIGLNDDDAIVTAQFVADTDFAGTLRIGRDIQTLSLLGASVRAKESLYANGGTSIYLGVGIGNKFSALSMADLNTGAYTSINDLPNTLTTLGSTTIYDAGSDISPYTIIPTNAIVAETFDGYGLLVGKAPTVQGDYQAFSLSGSDDSVELARGYAKSFNALFGGTYGINLTPAFTETFGVYGNSFTAIIVFKTGSVLYADSLGQNLDSGKLSVTITVNGNAYVLSVFGEVNGPGIDTFVRLLGQTQGTSNAFTLLPDTHYEMIFKCTPSSQSLEFNGFVLNKYETITEPVFIPSLDFEIGTNNKIASIVVYEGTDAVVDPNTIFSGAVVGGALLSSIIYPPSIRELSVTAASANGMLAAINDLANTVIAKGYTLADAPYLVSSGGVVTDSLSSIINSLHSDAGVMSSIASGLAQSYDDIVSTGLVSDKTSWESSGDVAKSGGVASSLHVGVTNLSSDLESGGVASSVELSSLAEVFSDLASGGVLSSIITQHLSANELIIDKAVVRAHAIYDTLMQAWTMNSQTHAMSRYNGLPYRSIAAIGNRLIALGDTGFFELDSDADNGVPVDSMYVTGFEKLGTDKLKRLGNVDIGYSTKNAVSVLVREYGDTKLSYAYNLPTRTADAPRGGKVTLGKGLRSKYYQFTIKGQSLNLDYAQVEVFASENRKV